MLRPMRLHLSSKNLIKTLVRLVTIEMYTILFVKILMFNLLLGQEEKLLLISMVLILSLMLKDLVRILVRKV